MARVAALVLALAALVAVAGCGGSEDASPTPETVIGEIPTGSEDGGGATEGDPAAGKEVFASAGCGSCHTLSDAGATGTVANGGGGMQAFSGTLSEEEIANVAAYVVSARG